MAMKFKKEPGGNTKGNLVGHAGHPAAAPKRLQVASQSVKTRGNTPVVSRAEKSVRAEVKKKFK